MGFYDYICIRVYLEYIYTLIWPYMMSIYIENKGYIIYIIYTDLL